MTYRDQPTYDAETVIARLEEAGAALLAMPKDGPRLQTKSQRFLDVSAVAEAVIQRNAGMAELPAPDAATISRMDEAFGWLALIPQTHFVLRRIVAARSMVSPHTGKYQFPWSKIARMIGADYRAVQGWHANGIDLIVLNLRLRKSA